MAKYKQDDILTLELIDYGADGEGIAKQDDFVFFVPFGAKGEVVKAKVMYVNKRNLVFCKLLEVVKPSPKRVKPVCNRFMRCGGCDIMHLEYSEQLSLKRRNLATLLRKNAHIEFEPDEVVASSQFGYRNKIQLPFGKVNGKVATGFFQENSHKIVSITKCFLHGEWVEKLIAVVLEFAEIHKLGAYFSEDKGILRHIVARKLEDDFCITIVTNKKKLPFSEDLIKRLDGVFGEHYALYNSVKIAQNNVILGEQLFPLKEKKLVCSILGIKAEINPYSFLQLNDEIRDKIYQRVIDQILQGTGEKVVVDAYAGVGILGAVLAKNGIKVYNIEIVKEATRDGDKLAKANGLEENITNINGDAGDVLAALLVRLTKDKNLPYIILDPPRKGCSSEVLESIIQSKIEKVFYISCNPATLTRDLKVFLENNFSIKYITPYDMFPQTKHVETLVYLEKID